MNLTVEDNVLTDVDGMIVVRTAGSCAIFVGDVVEFGRINWTVCA